MNCVSLKPLTNKTYFSKFRPPADVVELVDTLDSGSSVRKNMEVQVLSSALNPARVRGFLFKSAIAHRVKILRSPFPCLEPLF